MAQPATRTLAGRSAGMLLVLSYVGFISLGLPDSIVGAAWPAVRRELALPLAWGGHLTLISTVGVVLSSGVSGHLLVRQPIGRVLAASTVLAAIALLLYARARVWPVFLGAALLAGWGGGAVDAALNRFVATHYSARHMTWLHGCWGVGATLGPLTVASALGLQSSWRSAYLAIALVELALALAFLATARRWNEGDAAPAAPEAHAAADAPAPGRTATEVAAMRAGVCFFFVYCGIEASVGLWGASLLTATRAASLSLAGGAVSVYWGMLMLGRFVLGAVVQRLGPSRLLTACCVGAIVALVAMSVPGTSVGWVSAAFGLLGFALAPIYPLLMHETPRRFQPATARVMVGYQIAAGGVGIALVPWLIGLLAESSSLHVVPPSLCLLALVLLQLRRHQGTWKPEGSEAPATSDAGR
jgi:fucose permease